MLGSAEIIVIGELQKSIHTIFVVAISALVVSGQLKIIERNL
jgi:hypothetical protein